MKKEKTESSKKISHLNFLLKKKMKKGLLNVK